MADNEEGEETTPRGNEWEVVSLTASAYAAAPGLREVELKDGDKSYTYGDDEAEMSHGLFMSRHFVFPPSEHENLPLESNSNEIHDDVVSEVSVHDGRRSRGKDEAAVNFKALHVRDEFPGIQFFDEKGNRQAMDVVDREQSIHNDAEFSSFCNEAVIGGSTIPEIIEPSEQVVDYHIGMSQSPEPTKDGAYDGPDLPCEAWWKRSAASLYSHAKEANTFWSIFIAAAVMGLVILGQQWQQERWKVLQLKWQSSINEEKMSRMMRPIIRLKDVIVGGHRRGTFIRGSSTRQN